MHKFIEYISDLLFLHDCVIIPDFGGFICNYKPACINEANGVICPPSKDILFNRNLTHNDGLLVNWVACKENTSYDKAAKQVSLFCEELKVRLNQRQRVAFGDVGVFYTDRRFNIIFENGRGNYLSDVFGMEEILAEKIQPEEKVKSKNISIPVTNEPASYINTDSGNFLHRLFKYGLSVAVIAGIIVLSQLNISHNSDGIKNFITNLTSVQPMPDFSTPASSIKRSNVISPIEDYITYDPLQDLER